MQRQPVESSSLASVGHEERVLEVEFHNGGVYQYLGVPASVHRELLSAESLGAFLNTQIKPRFPYVRVDADARGARRR
ncbi:MAG TPA: KTSC domain-containing protein [Thermoanaerobaculia bacterium]|nr:KTSC domain-containing protein [Thermoanaerobaculia bacterium]